MERDEVQGRCGWSWSSIKATRMDWVKAKKIIILIQMSLGKHPDLPDIPLVTELAKSEEQRQIFKLIFARQVMGRPYMAPPGVPNGRRGDRERFVHRLLRAPFHRGKDEDPDRRNEADQNHQREEAGDPGEESHGAVADQCGRKLGFEPAGDMPPVGAGAQRNQRLLA